MISIYQSLSEVNVQENQVINQGDVIGKVVNPENYYNKKIKEL